MIEDQSVHLAAMANYGAIRNRLFPVPARPRTVPVPRQAPIVPHPVRMAAPPELPPVEAAEAVKAPPALEDVIDLPRFIVGIQRRFGKLGMSRLDQGMLVRKIQADCAAEYGVTVLDLKSMRRSTPVIRARMKAYWLIKWTTSYSFPEIGRKFGNKDHTTIWHGVRRFEQLEPQYCADFRAMQEASDDA